MSSTDNVVRPVGSQAKFNTARHSLGILRAVIVTCRYRVSTAHLRRQSLSLHDAIEHALATVVLGQAMLRVGIAGEETEEPAFVHLKTIDMRRMIEWKELVVPASESTGTRTGVDGNNEDGSGSGGGRGRGEGRCEDRLFRSLERHHEALWDDLANKPGWKIVVHHDPGQLRALRSEEREGGSASSLSLDISFCFHHAYADGRGGYIFHGDLQRALNTITTTTAAAAVGPSELQDHILHLPTAPVLPPPMAPLIPFTTSWGFVLRTAWAEVLYPVIVPRALRRLLGLEPREADLPWTGAAVDGSNPRVHIRKLFEVDGEARAKRILARCRDHGASLTGLLHALIGRSLARRVPSSSSFRSMTPISLAAYADPVVAGSAFTPGETIHCLVTGLTCDHPPGAFRPPRAAAATGVVGVDDDDDALWTEARRMTARLRARAAELPRDDILALAGLVGDWHEFFRGKFGKPRDASWELSNLGSLDLRLHPGDGDGGSGAVGVGTPIRPANPSGAERGNGMEITSGYHGNGNSGSDSDGGWWRIDRAIFTQGANAVGAAINVNVAGVAGRGLYTTVSWQDGIVDPDLVEGLICDVRAYFAAF